MSTNLEQLYLRLYPKALTLTSRVMSYLPSCLVMEIANDITVDFLFFSRSFKETYDGSKGSIFPFFVSYVRLKLRGVREDVMKELAVCGLDSIRAARAICEVSDFERWADLKSVVTITYHRLKDRECRGVSVASVFKAGLFDVANHGRTNVKRVCELLKTDNRAGVRDSLNLIQSHLVMGVGGENEPAFYSR